MTTISARFISYSANHEDVILNRVFGDRSRGFYIDVGAAHPLFENDTKALYDRGWRGINIEPNVAFFQALSAARQEDRNINAAVSDSSGEIAYHEVKGTGLSTCDADEADRAADKGFEVVRHMVAAVTLRAVLEETTPPAIDLLKVDVEGFELRVLQSNDWDRFRPKVVVVEATYPESPRRRDDGVRAYLIKQGYNQVYFDGLNDYYVEQAFQPPAGAFERPLSLFDHYESYEQYTGRIDRENAKTYIASLEQERENAQTYVASLEQELARTARELRRVTLTAEATSMDVEHARRELRVAHERCRGLAAQLHKAGATQTSPEIAEQLRQVYLSTSWRITRPLRALKRPRRTLRRLLGRGSP